MSNAFLIQTAISVVAVSALVLLTLWARIPRPTPPLDRQAVLAVLSDEYPEFRIDQVWIGQDGASALAASGDQALTLSRLGDSYVSRQLPWSELAAARRKGETVSIHLKDPAAPHLAIAWPQTASWPPTRS